MPLISMFNQKMNTNTLLMELATRDLHSAQIGVNYLCIKTKKEWQPFLTEFSIVAGSSIGVFTIFFSVLFMVIGAYSFLSYQILKYFQHF